MRELTIAAMLSIVASAAAAQNPGQVAAMSCKNAAVKEVRAQRPEADSIRFSPNPSVEEGRGETAVRGAGQYLHRGRREWRPFIYDCVYRTRSAKTRVTVEFDSPSGTL